MGKHGREYNAGITAEETQPKQQVQVSDKNNQQRREIQRQIQQIFYNRESYSELLGVKFIQQREELLQKFDRIVWVQCRDWFRLRGASLGERWKQVIWEVFKWEALRRIELLYKSSFFQTKVLFLLYVYSLSNSWNKAFQFWTKQGLYKILIKFPVQ